KFKVPTISDISLYTVILYRVSRNSTHYISFNQSMVSRLYNGVDVPKTLTAVRNWISSQKK
ncbi:5702_t:CDS:1, partial [Rhizophagus irregularis]